MRLLLVLLMLLPTTILAQAEPRTPSHCIALAESTEGLEYVTPASLPQVAREEVYLHYIAHASFLVRSHAGLNMVTDFTGFTGTLPLIPDVVTMNHAHETHWTANPDPAIPYVLRGWNHDGKGPADYKLKVEDVTIRNVTTDIRGWGEPEVDGNSIFIFEVADLCIGHLGHLHHSLTDDHYAKIGRLDIVMAPVDGTYTLDLPQMINILKTLKARIVLPMHAFGTYTLEQFITGMSDEFAVDLNRGSSLEVGFHSLPSEPTVVLLPSNPGLEPDLGFD